MSDEEKTAGQGGTAAAAASVPTEQPSLDEHTTVPNAPEPEKRVAQPPSGKWQMPKPKFQQTSGYLPQGYLKDVDLARTTVPGSEDTTREHAAFIAAPESNQPATSTPPAVEPQPDIGEIIPEETPVETVPAQTSAKGTSGLPVIVLVLVGIAAFFVIFLAAVYFLFLRQPSGSTGF